MSPLQGIKLTGHTTAVELRGKRALVIGATGGIGGAIAERLSTVGAQITALGRDPARLSALKETIPAASFMACNFTEDEQLSRSCRELSEPKQDLDLVVLSSGEFRSGAISDSGLEEFERAFTINVKAPYALLRAALPGIVRKQGQIAIVSSSAALRGRAGAALYSATHAALRSLAESLRDEVNQHGVRVLVVYPGRTATDIWARAALQSGQPYRPELLLQPADIAESVLSALSLPRTAELTDLHLRPLQKSY